MFGEVFLCQFPFTSGASSKIRPALVLFDLQDDVIVCRLTSILHNGPFDVRLNDWASSGLLKPSVARLDRIITAEKTIFFKRLGVLSVSDKEAVRNAWNRNMRL